MNELLFHSAYGHHDTEWWLFCDAPSVSQRRNINDSVTVWNYIFMIAAVAHFLHHCPTTVYERCAPWSSHSARESETPGATKHNSRNSGVTIIFGPGKHSLRALVLVLIHKSGHSGPPLPFWAPTGPRHCRGCRWLVTPLDAGKKSPEKDIKLFFRIYGRPNSWRLCSTAVRTLFSRALSE